jgi:hypothetical protein
VIDLAAGEEKRQGRCLDAQQLPASSLECIIVDLLPDLSSESGEERTLRLLVERRVEQLSWRQWRHHCLAIARGSGLRDPGHGVSINRLEDDMTSTRRYILINIFAAQLCDIVVFPRVKSR